MKTTAVILVDEADNAIGTMEKMEAHRRGLLHRAISVFVFDSAGRLLLQQRAAHKYHCGGLWTNTCCTHPMPGEPVLSAAHRRLREEMGLTVASLTFAFTLTYRARFDNGLVEHELDHVFIGYADDTPTLNPEEVAAYRWASFEAIESEMVTDEARFTVWFKQLYKQVFAQQRAQ